ncbi:MAG: hypothetical protein AAF204_03870 [Pseudomonadota bacterium]
MPLQRLWTPPSLLSKSLKMLYLAAYIILTVLIIFWAARNLSQEGYLLADRDVPPWAVALSLTVSKFGGGKILAGGSLIYLFGISAMWFNIGFLLGYMLFTRLAYKLKEMADQNQFYTMTDYYKKTAGEGAVFPIGLLCAYTMLGFTCINLVGGAHILQKMSGIPYEFSVLFVTGFIGIYLLVGGFKSVIVTDVLQGVIIISGMVLFVVFASLPSDVDWGYHRFLADFGKTQIIYTFFMGFFFPFGMPEVWPRIYALRKKEDLKQTIPITIFAYVGLGILLAILILSIRESFPDMPPPQAILSGFQSLLPSELAGLIAVFLFAAIMSSADTYLFQTNAALEQDLKFFNRFFPKLDNIRTKMRMSIIGILALAVCIAFFFPDIIKVLLIFAAGNFILGVFGLVSRFYDIPLFSLKTGIVGGVVAILIGLFLGGLSYHIPLCAMFGTSLGLILSLVKKPRFVKEK